jgi:Mesyanzhinovviridae DNA primase
MTHDITKEPMETRACIGLDAGAKNATPAKGADAIDDDPDLLEMNDKYAVVKVGGKTRVVSFEDSEVHPGCRVPVYSTIADFKAFYTRRKLDKASGREVGIGDWWIRHQQRRQFDGIVYSPNANAPGKLNLWTGLACEPCPGDCSLFLQHIRDNVCSGNEEHYQYLLNWMARGVTRPGAPGEVAVVLRGKEGTGKGVLAREYGKIFGPHFRHISQARHLTGNFNSHLQQVSLLYADEAFFAGDRGHESALKNLITEPTLFIEPKGIDPFPVKNCIHLVVTSNSDWVVPAGADARRFFVLDVSDARMQQAEYFAAIVLQMDGGGRSALLHQLLERDLSQFNVRTIPQTPALAEQKRHSRRGIDQLIEIIAQRSCLPDAHPTYPNIAITSQEEKGRGFYVSAKRLASDLKYKGSQVIAHELTKHWRCESWKNAKQRGLKFPPLGELRRLFDERHGKQTWSDVEDWTGQPDEESYRDVDESPPTNPYADKFYA